MPWRAWARRGRCGRAVPPGRPGRPRSSRPSGPVMRQPSPSRSARVANEARSLPEPGSLNSWHQTSSAAHDRRQEPRRCSSVPIGEQRGRGEVEAERVESRQVIARERPARPRPRQWRATSPGPPYARSHRGTTSPERPNTGYHVAVLRRRADRADGRGAAGLGRCAPRRRDAARRPTPHRAGGIVGSGLEPGNRGQVE